MLGTECYTSPRTYSCRLAGHIHMHGRSGLSPKAVSALVFEALQASRRESYTRSPPHSHTAPQVAVLAQEEV